MESFSLKPSDKSVLLFLVIFSSVTLTSLLIPARASSYYYQLTLTDSQLSVGENIYATATTDNPSVSLIDIEWWHDGNRIYKDSGIKIKDTLRCFTGGGPVWQEGTWIVKAIFRDSSGSVIAETDPQNFVVDAPELFAVPEYPLGSILGIAICLSAFVVFKSRRLRLTHSTIRTIS